MVWEKLMVDLKQMKTPTTRQMGTTSRGFTIVELLIVVVVIAILAAITIVAYTGINQRAKTAASQSAAQQAIKKIQTYMVTNNDQPPASLADAGVSSTGGTQYQYTLLGTGYCVTATQSGQSAYAASNFTYNGGTVTDQLNPVSGACPGHSPSGTGTIITNMAKNPSFETGTAGWGTSSANIAQSSTWASSGSQSLRVVNTGTSNAGDARFSSTASTMLFGMQPGKTYTISAKVNIPVAPTGGLGRAPGILIWYSTNGSSWNESFGPKAPAAAGTYTVSHTITLPNDITGIMIGLGVASTTASQSFYYDSFMVTEGSTVYPYADGSSTNWLWVGTPHDSASMGPLQ